MRLLLGLSIFICTAFCFKTEPITIVFTPKFGSEVLVPEKNYFLPAINDSVSISVFRFYVSDVCFLKKGKVVSIDKNRFHLLDLENQLKINIQSNLKDFDAIRFNIGIDSTTNSGGVKGGDLDPTKNMYWAWQSGYINFKLEGKSKVCKTRNNVFQYHIGGYSYPNNSLQTVTIPINHSASININFDLEKLLSGIGLQTTNEIMSPSAKAMQVAKLYKTVFEAQ
ncbi:MAG: hypothetical protein KA163_12265 [Bacteroidia bacterium]|nr:hypothetical protein [Bacteroidia bacterium]